ncbi:uncharacterized protein LOC116350221 [Contarinia nasturtii]|uniref:uncharacterized protein LOC116350221 n=1 Tax=Contarinia nasturtii TaxID=265458 RepID=UPI0012D3A499|nr:uncharacterized protein LOC116350221 [Contarinia nasturtii]
MKTKLTLVLIVNVIFIWNGVDCSYPFEELANELRNKETEHKAAANSNDPNAVYKTNAETYAKKFKTFLDEYDKGNNVLPCQKFRELDSTAWEGHYMMKVYMDDGARQEIALNNTKFQNVHKDIILKKHLDIMHNYIQYFLSKWSRNISDIKKATAVHKVNVAMDEVKDRFTEALLLLAESNDTRFKKNEVYLIYFYLQVRRIVEDSDFHTDQFIYDEFQKLVDLYVTEPNSLSSIGKNAGSSRGSSLNRVSSLSNSRTSSPISSAISSTRFSPMSSPKSPSKAAKIGNAIRKKLTPRFIRKKDDITKYVDAKLKIIKKCLSSSDKEAKFNEVATAFINLYYNIFEDAPDKFDVTKIHEQYLKFINSYGGFNKKQDIKYFMVTDGYLHLIQVFGEPKTKKSKHY